MKHSRPMWWALSTALLMAHVALGADAGATPPKLIVEVVDAAGKPVPSARVLQGSVGSARQRMHGGFNTYETNQQGLMWFNFQAGTAFSVSVSKPGTVSVRRDLTMPAQGEKRERFVLVPGVNISGTVVDAAGLAVANASVSGTLPNCEPTPGSMCSAGYGNTAADGTFLLNDVPTGPLKLSVNAPGGRNGEMNVTAPAKDVKVVLPAAIPITGRVLRAGKPVAGVKIFIERPKAEPLSKDVRMARKVFGPGVPGVSATTGADGRFTIDGMAPVPYAIWAEGDGYESEDQVIKPGTDLVLKLDKKSP